MSKQAPSPAAIALTLHRFWLPLDHGLTPAQAYSNNLVDHHLILDLLPGLAAAFFAGHLPASMSLAQAAILLAMV